MCTGMDELDRESLGMASLLIDIYPYPAYKPSGVPWLGDVPRSWQVRRIKTLLRESEDRKGQKPMELLSLTRVKGLIPQSENSSPTLLAEDLSRYKICRPTDIVMNRMQAWSGMFAVPPSEGIVSPDYSVFTPTTTVEITFFEHLLKTPILVEQFARESRGIGSGFNRLYSDDFGNIAVVLPPLPEQTAVVRYLDHADRRIQRYLSAKRKLIALLEEKKQVIVNRSVTRGLDPNVRLKPSGLEWLGDVPEHWEILQFGRVIDLATGYPFNSEGFSFDADDIRLLRGINVSLGVLRWRDVVRWPRADCNALDDYRMEIGDIVLGMDRPFIEGGVRVASVSENDVPALLLQRVARIRPRQELSSTFTSLLLSGKSFADYLKPLFTGISVPHVSPEQIRSYRIALPCIREQNEIVDHVMSVSRSIQLMTERARRQIELLEEYRTRLIADVVTGKLDVRDAAAQLPDEADDQDQIEECGPLSDSLDEEIYDAEEEPAIAEEVRI